MVGPLAVFGVTWLVWNSLTSNVQHATCRMQNTPIQQDSDTAIRHYNIRHNNTTIQRYSALLGRVTRLVHTHARSRAHRWASHCLVISAADDVDAVRVQAVPQCQRTHARTFALIIGGHGSSLSCGRTVRRNVRAGVQHAEPDARRIGRRAAAGRRHDSGPPLCARGYRATAEGCVAQPLSHLVLVPLRIAAVQLRPLSHLANVPLRPLSHLGAAECCVPPARRSSRTWPRWHAVPCAHRAAALDARARRRAAARSPRTVAQVQKMSLAAEELSLPDLLRGNLDDV